MNPVEYVKYLGLSLARGTLGSYISVGIFILIGVCMVTGTYYGVIRGFSKSVIRYVTVLASALCSLLTVMGISKLIVRVAIDSAPSETQKLDELLNSRFPGFVDAMPEIVKPIISEIDAGTATIFVMMVVAVLLSPVLFIGFFYLLKMLSVFVYELLSALTGAISFGKPHISAICGGVVGFIQGLSIAAIIIMPISGLCNVATDAKDHLMGDPNKPNEYVVKIYDKVIDDLADNPVFDVVDNIGGKVAYRKMITVNIDGEHLNMGKECVGAAKVLADLLPMTEGQFKWEEPTDKQRETFDRVIKDIGDDDLVASLAADVMRGVSVSVREGKVNHGLTGAAKRLIDDVMLMFSTSTEETIEGDLDVILDVYLIMCDKHLMDDFKTSDPNGVRNVLTEKDENGKTPFDYITGRLKEYDRADVILTSFTKLSLSAMQQAQGFDENIDELYEGVKDGVTNVLTHNKSDFETEEEYREAITADLDKTLADNNLQIDESIKQDMLDYISDNYGDFTGEITESEVNDALLSYYQAYANANGTVTPPNTEDTPGGDNTTGDNTTGDNTTGDNTVGDNSDNSDTNGSDTAQ